MWDLLQQHSQACVLLLAASQLCLARLSSSCRQRASLLGSSLCIACGLDLLSQLLLQLGNLCRAG